MESIQLDLPETVGTVDGRGAEIIPFPRVAAPTAAPSEDRLTVALAALDRAIAVQRSAIGGWRAAIADLDQAMGNLAGSVGRYQAQLGNLASSVEALGQRAADTAAS